LTDCQDIFAQLWITNAQCHCLYIFSLSPLDELLIIYIKLYIFVLYTD